MLKKLNKSNDKGFTIIEVMIVLAIAGLIMLIVFLAVPALQRNSRNTQRKNDIQAVLGGISSYTSNNNGTAPGTFADIQTEVKTSYYIGTDINFLSTGGVAATNAAIAAVDQSLMYVRIGARCNVAGNNVGGANATTRSVAIVYTVETGASGATTRCQES